MLYSGNAIAYDRRTGNASISTFDCRPNKSGWVFVHELSQLYVVPYWDGSWKLNVLPVNDNCKKAKVSLCKGSMRLKNNLPYSFDMQYKLDGKTEITTLYSTDRIDRKGLADNKRLALQAGYETTFLVGLVGPVGSGKTCFWHSVRCPASFNRLAAFFEEQLTCDTVPENVDRPSRSNLPTFDGTSINIENSHGHTVANIMLFDLAGEMTRDGMRNLEDIEIQKSILRSSKCFDALFVFVKGDSLFCHSDEVIGNVNNFLRKLDKALNKAIIITEADKIRERLQSAECSKSFAGNSSLEMAQLRNNATLKSTSPVFEHCKTMEDIYRHIALARSVYGDIAGGGSAPCFLVSTLNEESKNDGQINFNFSKAINAELPLVWLLSHFRKLTLKNNRGASF